MFGLNSKFNFTLEKERDREAINTKKNHYSFRVLVTSDGSGLIETLRNTISIHSIKKDAYTRGWNEKGAVFTLYDYFEKVNLRLFIHFFYHLTYYYFSRFLDHLILMNLLKRRTLL